MAVRLSSSAAKLLDEKVDSIFERLIKRLLGHAFVGKNLWVTTDPELSLPGIFAAATTAEGGQVEPALLTGVASIARDYLMKHKEEAKAKTKHTINALLQDVKHGRIPREDFQNHVESTLTKLWGTVKNNVERVVATETNNAAIMGQKSALDTIAGSMGIDDPTYAFICVHDSRLCDECLRLHCLPDKTTPRVWKASEISSEYHVKGGDRPSWGDLHPNGRCFPTLILPGFGFDRSGKVTWIGEGHDELGYQRGYRRPPRGEEARVKRLERDQEK